MLNACLKNHTALFYSESNKELIQGSELQAVHLVRQGEITPYQFFSTSLYFFRPIQTHWIVDQNLLQLLRGGGDLRQIIYQQTVVRHVVF